MIQINTNNDDLVIVFYHKDQDGALSCSLIKNYYDLMNVKSYLFPVDYNNNFDLNYFIHTINNCLTENDQHCNNPKIFMVDYTCVDFDLLFKNCEDNDIKLVWIDHHISSIDKYKNIQQDVDGKRSVLHSGCYLTYNFLYPNNKNIPKIVDIIDQFDRNESTPTYDKQTQLSVIDYLDTYDIDLNNSKLYQQYINCIIDENNINYMIQSGLIIYTYLKQQAKNNLINVIKTQINNIPCLVLNTYQHGGWLFDDYEDNDKYMLVVWYCDNQNNYRYSFYSDNDSEIDCSIIASSFNGGGHKHATGCLTDHQIFSV